MPQPATPELTDQWSNKWWRLNNLYWIQDTKGDRIPFRCNDMQERLFDDLWYFNIILKARQFGMTTLVDLYLLDEVMFNPFVEAAIIAHNKDDAVKIFRRKIQFPYDNLPDGLKSVRYPVTDTRNELALNNDSTIYVATSIRSGTVQYLHVSEHAKICRKYPEKAQEIKTGSLNAVHAGQMVFIESTAEGNAGDFHDFCMAAKRHQQEGRRLTELDFKFHFFPWYESGKYAIDPEGVVITDYYRKYFEELEAKAGIVLTDAQKAWYVKKAATMGDTMWQEYPSTPDEAFKASIQGAYFHKQFIKIYKERRIINLPYDQALPVSTAWDLGVGDATAIWFYQIHGDEVRLIDYHEAEGEGLPYYARVLRQKGYGYDRHIAPHDIAVRDLSTGKSRREKARELGIVFEVAPKLPKEDQIEAARRILEKCWFDEVHCDEGIKALENYRKEWDDKRGVYKDKPLHDWASNGADAFQILAVSYDRRFNLFPDLMEM